MTFETGMKTIGELEFGVLFFASGEDSMVGDKYRFLLDCARFADEHGFSSVWVPERHFTRFGCLYPNPAVLHAALAVVTQRVRLCAGSVVMPLHDPIRVAEEWAVVDNLSNGRVGVSVAPGWNPNDFAFFPERYPDRKGEMYRTLEVVQKIWRGEELQITNGAGRRVAVRVYPTPVQPRLPVWVTASGNPETFEAAGTLGANLLTHLLDQDVETLAGKIRLYRQARASHGHDPHAGLVTCMLHTYVGQDAHETREQARRPYCNYLKSNLDLAKGLAYNRGHKIDFEALSEKDLDQFLNFLYDRFVFERALIGSPETCEPLCASLFVAGVDEIAALLDFGPPEDLALRNLSYLDELRRRCVALPPEQHERPALSRPAPDERPEPVAARGEVAVSSLESVRRRCTEEWERERFYALLERAGCAAPDAARGVTRLWRRDGEALAEVGVQASPTAEAALLQACLDVTLAALPEQAGGALLLPASLQCLQGDLRGVTRVLAHVVLRGGAGASAEACEADVKLYDHDGTLRAGVAGLRLQRAAVPSAAAEESVSDWIYRIQWEARPALAVAPEQRGTWLVLRDRSGVGDALIEALRSQGHACVARYVDELPSLDVPLDDASGRAFTAAMDEAWAGPAPWLGVLHLWSLDATPPANTSAATLLSDQRLGARSAVQLVQALTRRQGGKRPRLWLVTRGVHAVGERRGPLAVSQAPLWAIGRTCAVEYPDIWGGLVDLDPAQTPERAARQILETAWSEDREDHVALSGDQRFVCRLAHHHVQAPAPLQVRPDAAYLITGGLDGLGLVVAHWLVRLGARHLILVGRTRIPPREEWDAPGHSESLARRLEGLRSLEALGVHVQHPAVDVTDEPAMRALFERCARDGTPPIAGAVHAASVWRGPQGQGLVGPLAQTTPLSFDHVLPTKMVGSWLLQELLPPESLDFIVLFSAGAALLGSAGQGTYAAANAFLDALAHDVNRRKGVRTLAVNWGPVTEIGFGVTPEGRAMHGLWERRGILGISPAQVVAALELLVPESLPQAGVMRTDWSLLKRAYAEMLAAPWASLLVDGIAVVKTPDLPTLLDEAAPADRHELLALYIQEQVVLVMGLSPADAPEFDQGLFDIGMDSLLALELKTRIQGALRCDFSATALFDHPTVGSLAEHLLVDVLRLPVAETAPGASTPTPTNILDDIEALSDEEVERLLAQRLVGGAA